jgi:hypothetical protein
MIKSVWSRGLFYCVGVAINRVVPERLFRCRVFRVYQLRSPTEGKGVQTPVLVHACTSDEDFRRVKQLTRFGAAGASPSDRYEAFLAMDPEQPVGGAWRAVDHFDEREIGMRIMLESDQAWVFAAHVDRSRRGQGIYCQLLSSVLASDPSSKHYAAINPTNKASLAAHHRFIQSAVGTCIAVRVVRWTFAWAGAGLGTTGHFTFNSHSRPIELRIVR